MNLPQVYPCSLPLEHPSHLPPHSTFQVVTEPQFEFPESYSKFPLAIYFTFGNVYFHVTLFIHPTVSFFPTTPAVSISLFSMSMSPLLLQQASFFFLTLQYCISFAKYQNESATGIHVFPILNPPPSSLPIPFLWVVPVHQPQASSIGHRTWTGDSFHT